MSYTLVKRKSQITDKKVWMLRDSKTGYYKQIAMGERAEFPTKKQAKKYLNQVRRSLKKAKKSSSKRLPKGWKKVKSKNPMWKKGLTILVIRPRQVTYSGGIRVGAYDLDVYSDIGWTSEKRDYGNTFKTKSQAMKFAKRWMRNHPRG